jgi:hypothetical protein
MDIKHLENYVEMKINEKEVLLKHSMPILADSKRVALSELDGQTIIVTEFEGGFHKLQDGNWELSLKQKDIDAWNTKHGLDKEQVEKIIDDSFYFNHINSNYIEQLDKYKSKKNKE